MPLGGYRDDFMILGLLAAYKCPYFFFTHIGGPNG